MSTETEPQSTDEDVVVVGGGLGGYAAALSAAEANASVRLLVTDEDRFAREPGVIDLLGTAPGDSGPVADPFEAIERLPGDHRYSQLGLDAVRTALSRFDDATGERYRGAATERNALVPTCVGRLQPAARYPAAMAEGLAGTSGDIRLVGFDRVADFDAGLATNRLRSVLAADVEYSTIKTPYKVDQPPVVRKIAAALDDNRTNDEGTTTRESLANVLRPVLDTEPRVGVPAVLGVDEAPAIREYLESRLQARLFEVPLGPPSLPGLRLEATLASALDEAGVTIERDVTVTEVDASDGTVESVRVGGSEGEELGHRAGSSFVLATGGVAAGGIQAERAEMQEPLFGCAVSAPAERTAWTDERFFGDHQAIRAGVSVDDELRPSAAEGDGSFENLYAAGRVLASSNVVQEGSAGGVALTTGDVAGRHAAE